MQSSPSTLIQQLDSQSRPLPRYYFELTWPTSWAVNGYTTFMFGCESAAESRRWHGLLAGRIAALKEISLLGKSHKKFGQHSREASASGLVQASSSSLTVNPEPDPRLSHRGGAAGNVNGTGPALQRTSASSAPDEFFDPVNGAAGRGVGLEDEDDEEEESYAVGGRMLRRRARSTRPGPGWCKASAGSRTAQWRWVPYRQTNGVAIYHHESPPGESCVGCKQEHRASVGGEYMASTIVRGTPSAVLQALLHGSSSSILGPASHVKVVSRVSLPGLDSEVLHITLEAPGYAGVFCAPRELRVERMVKVDETGLFVVMFKSLDDQHPTTTPAAPKTAASQAAAAGTAAAPSPPATTTTTMTTTAAAASDGSSDSGRSFYRRSVTGWVRGGYTIAPRSGFSSDDSPDSLITCILKVDLGGACSPASWLRPLSDSLGWTDAFVDRILMSIQLVRDEVEHRGFVSTPFAVTGTQERRKGPARASVSSTSADVSAASVLAPTTSAPLATAAPIGGFRRTMSKQRKSAVNWVSLTDAEKQAASTSSPALLPLPEQEGDSHAAGLEALSLLEHTRAMSTLGRKFWEPIHSEGTASPFMVRGATYLKDKRKVAAGLVECPLASYDFVQLVAPIEDIARFLPSVIRSPFPFSIVINIVIPGNPPISSAATFGCTRHPASMGEPPLHPMQGGHDWAPFDFLLHRFYYGTDAVRDSMLKLIPHIAEGSWVIRQSIGTTPAILGKALKTTYHVNDRYMEASAFATLPGGNTGVDVDISANSVANYITGLARGTTRSMVIDMGFLLEGTSPWELPESLLCAVRLVRLDMKGNLIDLVNEVPKAEQ
ncbi:MAG: hypothetical protein WDW38_007495 [Sanguina aurantia]